MDKTINEDRVSRVWLQIDTYDEYENCKIKQFEVPKWWLQNQIMREFATVNKFLDEYTSEESMPIYEQAILEDMILCEV